MDVNRIKSRESGRGVQEDEVVLFVPNAHCPSCVSHITTLLEPFTASSSSTPQLYDLAISYLTHKVSFRLAPTSASAATPSTPKRELLIHEVEALIRDAGFDVERISPVVIQGAGGVRVRREVPAARLVEAGGHRAGVTGERGWVERWTGRVGRKERARRERRRRHVEVCDECQRDEAGANVPGDGTATDQAVEGEDKIEIGVQEPGQPEILETVFSVEGMFCGSCTGTIHTSLLTHTGIIRATVNLLANSATVVYDSAVISTDAVKEVIEDTGYGAEVVESKTVREDGMEVKKKVRVTGEDKDVKEMAEDKRMISRFAVGGMTCSACTTSISDLLSAHPSISASEVSVLTSSATVTHLTSLPTDAIVEIIDDSGFECSFISSSPVLAPIATASDEVSDRTVTLLVDGMFCHQCVKKVNATLITLSADSAIKSFTPITLTCPTTTITYTPTATINVRTLLALLGPALDPAFVSSLVKPPSITSRAREIQAREAKVLLRHFLIAFAFAIPTFVVAIVGMVLLPKTHPFREYWMEPVWGGAGKGTVVLFVSATIVQFGVGRIFYQRSFRTLLPHLRRRRRGASASAAPPLQRSFNWRSLFSFGSMDLLVVSSTTTAYFSSVAMMAVDVTSPREMTMGEAGAMMVGEEKMMTLFDASVFLIFFILAGRVLEAYAKTRTGDAVAMLGTLRPDSALLLTSDAPKLPESATSDVNLLSKTETSSSSVDTKVPDGPSSAPASAGVGNVTTLSVPVDHLEINDLILVQPGSLPPTDGTIVRGTTTFDESSLTGESKPVKKAAGDEVLTGTVNLTGAIVVRVEKLGDETMIEKIVRAVSEAQGQKSPVEYLAERVTGVFVPVVVYFAILVLIVWLSLTLSGTLSDAAIRKGPNPSSGDRVFFAFEFFIAVLVVACPCGIGLAAPTAAAVGLGLAAQKGVLAQGGGTSFQAATKVDTVVFDKTGTLTLGKPSVTDHDLTSHPLSPVLAPDSDKNAQPSFLLSAVRQMEEQSSHPLASALRAFCTDQLSTYPSLANVTAGSSEEITGRGLKGVVVLSTPGSSSPSSTSFEVCIGNEAFMEEIGATTPEGMDQAQVDKWKNEAKSIVLVAVKSLSAVGARGYVVAARFAIADPPRPDAVETVKALRESGKEVWMLSGDNEATAKAVAIQVGIDPLCVKASVLPEGKADHIRSLQRLPSITPKSGSLGKRFVLFAGDGLNDSVALAAADVGVAMGSGSQVSVVSADFVLLNSNLESLTSLLSISRRVFTRTKVNFGWALVFNCVCLPLAAGVFYPAGGVKLAPVWSALAMALSSVSVVSSSLALRWGW